MISVVLPCYNEEAAVGTVIERIKQSLQGLEFEIIVVDDGSLDKSREIAEGLGVRVISHKTRRGYGSAVKTGIKAAKFENVLFMDADGTYQPEEIPRFLELREFDIVRGIRQTKQHFHRHIGRFLLTGFVSFLTGRKIQDINTGMIMIKRNKILPFLKRLPNSFSFTTSITIKSLKEFYSYKEIPIYYDKRIGTSKLSFFQSAYHFPILVFRLATDYYPRKIYFPISILITFFGVYSLIQNLVFRNITDTTVVLLLSGLQVFLFGSIAEGIARRKQYHMKWFLFGSFIIFIMATYSLIRDVRSYNLGDTSVILLLGGLQTFLYALLSDTLSRT